MPRLCSRQLHRQNHNTESDDIETYYRVAVYLPFLDTMIEQLQIRFTDKTKAAALFSVLCPKTATCLPTGEAESNFSKLWNTYAPTLHANDVEPQDTIGLKGLSEFRQWVCKWKRIPADDTPADTLLSSLKQCDKNVFPTINALLSIRHSGVDCNCRTYVLSTSSFEDLSA